MGALCSCGKGEKLDDKHVNSKPPIVSKSNPHTSTTNLHTSDEILTDTLKTEITKAIDEYVATIPSAYQTERNRIVNEMSRSTTGSYLGFNYSDYPDRNGPEVNKLARKLVTSDEVKQQLIDKIDKHIDPIFLSRTSTWNSLSRETARPVIKVFIEKNINDAFNRLQLE